MFPDQLPHQTLGKKAGRKGGTGFWIKEEKKKKEPWKSTWKKKKLWKITMTKTRILSSLEQL